MIRITDKKKCCGCGGCALACPKHCIIMKEDEEGFLYPVLDEENCIDCGLCEKVCPCLNSLNIQPSLKKTYALKDYDDSRGKSSSGGAFASIARYVLENGGVVYGAAFNEQKQVVHTVVENLEDLDSLRGSKYVQSNLNDTYVQIKNQLKEGRKVLFSGVSCQVKGLNLFLKKRYDNLFSVEILCHGVPSPSIFKMYLEEVCKKHDISLDEIKSIFFRNPRSWKEFILSIQTNDGKRIEGPLDNSFISGFGSNLIVRPSCFDCSAKSLRAGSDILLGDFWGLEYLDSNFVDDKGVSLVILNTCRGIDLFNHLSSDFKEFNYAQALLGNKNIEHSQREPEDRTDFFKSFGMTNEYTNTIKEFTNKKLPLLLEIRHYGATILKYIGLRKVVDYVKEYLQRRLFFSGKLD